MIDLKLAVVGKDVSKSVSPRMHTFIAKKLGKKIIYDRVSVCEQEFEESVGELISEYDGLNITIPYKLSIIPHLEKIEGDAQVFGAVNTVNCKSLTGNNTDGLGFMLMLKNGGIEVEGKTFLLLGGGGAGRSCAKKLAEGGAKVFVYDKNFDSAKKIQNEFSGVTALDALTAQPYYAIINATGVGMHDTVGKSPVAEDIISQTQVAIDLIYNPAKSQFLCNAEKLGKKIINGKAMLFYQAYFAECIFFDIQPDQAQAEQFFKEYDGIVRIGVLKRTDKI